ncbi:hypothetical protein ELG78_09060 [Rhizobium leguminosarum]|nr:hypothetical protein ELG78_09060 [Rhizobium leguminosarum]
MELKPCPFCDGLNNKPEMRSGLGEWWAHCTNCDCSSKMCMSAESAAHVWNRRNSPTETALAAEVERLRGMIEKLKAQFSMLARFSRDGVKDVSHTPKRPKWKIIADEAIAAVEACEAALAQQKQEG